MSKCLIMRLILQPACCQTPTALHTTVDTYNASSWTSAVVTTALKNVKKRKNAAAAAA